MSENKKEMVAKLSNVKLVIGKGFDLYCGLKTTYADFLGSEMQKFQLLMKIIDNYDSTVNRTVKLDDKIEFWKANCSFKDISVWHLFFALLKKSHDNKKWNWCDIEKEIKDSLLRKTEKDGEVCWKNVGAALQSLLKASCYFSAFSTSILASFIYAKRNRSLFNTEFDFNYYLLDELKAFEKSFGIYIKNLHGGEGYEDRSFSTHTLFSRKANSLINKLCNKEEIRSIDTFNYDTLEIKDLYEKINHINGDEDNPIFGIDSDEFEACAPQSIFTKTNRRMELDIKSNEYYNARQFENLIVFGHSLNSADYNYFFASFDSLQMTNMANNNKVIFSYYIYDKEKESQIRLKQLKAVRELFEAYSKYKGNSFAPNKLLDILTFHRKVVLREIEKDEII
ncbi:MAG: hypothetical protein IJ194_00045 [Bacilli bacterium]|nr:hypothetical protein [Bacilli bacterium]